MTEADDRSDSIGRYQQQPYQQQPSQQVQPPPPQQYGQQQYSPQQYGNPAQPGYGYPLSSPYAPAPPRGMSITSFVLGLVSVFLWFSFIVPIVGFVLGIIGLRREPAGRGLAIAGIILNGVFVLGDVVLLLVIVLSIVGVIGALPLFFLSGS